jgi:uncharacterized membrane protein YphA (DoxX/SURF4 family)
MASQSRTGQTSRLFSIVLVVLRLALAGVFGYAAWVKLSQPWALFAISVDAYHILPHWAVIAVARTLPWLELLLALLLVTGLIRRIVTPAASLLLAVFFGLMVRAYLRGEAIDCGCFGPGEAISPLTLLRDGALLAASLLLAISAFRTRHAAPRMPLEREASALPEPQI